MGNKITQFYHFKLNLDAEEMCIRDRSVCVIYFLNAKSKDWTGVHRQVNDIYGEEAMTDSVVGKGVSLFNKGLENVHDDEKSGGRL